MNLIGAKVYYDGSHWIAIPHTERPFKRKRRKRTTDKDKTVEQFERAFNKAPKGKKAKKKEKLLKEFAPLFKDEQQASEFVETQFERLNRNRIERYKRLKRKAYLQQWHYFCTFTYSDEKHTEETFRKQLMNCLYHLASRKGWRYIGAWERGDKTERLHFHALMYIPPNAIQKETLENLVLDFTVNELSEPQNIEAVVNALLAIQQRNLKANSTLLALQKEQREIETAIDNTMKAIAQGIITKSTAQYLKSYEERQEELAKLITIEQSKETVLITEKEIRKYYEEALKLEPQMLVNYLIKEIVLYDNRTDIIYNSPIKSTNSPDDSQGFSFYTKSVRLGNKTMTVTLLIK